MADTLPATFCMVADNPPARLDRLVALLPEAWVLFNTSPGMLLMRPELSRMVFRMLFMGITT